MKTPKIFYSISICCPGYYESIFQPPTLSPTSARRRTGALPSYISTTPPSPITRYIPSLDNTFNRSSTSFAQHTSNVSVTLEPPAEFASSKKQLEPAKSVDNSSTEEGKTGALGDKRGSNPVRNGSKDVVTCEEVTIEQENGAEDDVEITMIDDEDSPELFHPSSPLEFDRNLPDIMEEEEEENGDEEKSLEEEEQSKPRGVHESCEQSNHVGTVQSQSLAGDVSGSSTGDANNNERLSVGLSVKEFDQFLKDLRLSQLLEITEEQSWRISRQLNPFERLPSITEDPPSGEEFSPRMSLLLPDEEHGGSSMVEMSQELVSALKVISTDCVQEGPPEFPSSPPPGKLLSPRQSFRIPGVERSLKRSLSHKEKDFLKMLGSCLERVEEERKETDQSMESNRNQTMANAATMPPFEAQKGLLSKMFCV